MFKFQKDHVLLAVAVLGIVVTGMLLFANSSYSNLIPILKPSGMSSQAIAQKSIDYLNKNVLPAGQTATLGEVTQESGLIKIKVNLGANSYTSYITNDGKLFFPEAFKLDTNPSTNTAATTPPPAQTTPPANLTKVDKPMLEAFIVSDCPYGLQMQRAMADAVAKIPSLADYVKVRYIGEVSGNTITAMHGDGEAQENLRQICIREEQPAKYWNYVACYMKKATGKLANGMPMGDAKACERETGVDSAKVNACMTTPSKGLAYAKADFALATKYNATGSPTVLLNGTTASEFDFGGRTSDAVRSMVCSTAQTAPQWSGTKLNTAQAGVSFSATYAAATDPANESTKAANCDPAK